jgi:alpha-beta hydrolase superfamily lysophospholipase
MYLGVCNGQINQVIFGVKAKDLTSILLHIVLRIEPALAFIHTLNLLEAMVQRTLFGSDVNIEIDDADFPKLAEIEAMDQDLPGCKHEWFESSYKNAKLHYRYWIPKGDVKGVAVFFHGIMSHCGQGLVMDGKKLSTTLISESFLNQGVAIYAFDSYGHGFSEGTRFLIPETWENNLKDCIVFAKMASEKHADVPLFIAGESYGGCLAIHTARHFQDNAAEAPKFDSLLLTAPAIEADLPPFPVFQILKFVLAPIFPTRTPFFMPNPITVGSRHLLCKRKMNQQELTFFSFC